MIRLAEAAAQIGKGSNGRMELVVFPNGQLGGDNDLLSQARQGAIEFCQPTGHIFSLILPVTAKTIVARNLNAAALLEREDIARKDKMVQGDLETVGVTFNSAETQSFRDGLKEGGFYKYWHDKLGDVPWAL